MKTSIKTIGLLAALAMGLTSPLFSQVPDLTMSNSVIGIVVTAAPPATPAVADPIPADSARVGPGAAVVIKKDADIAGGTLVLNGGTLNLQGGLSAASTLVLAADTVSTIDSSAKGGGTDLHATILGSGKLNLSGTCANLRIGYLQVLTPTSMGSGAVTLGGKATAEHVVGFVTLVPLTVQNPVTLIGIPDGATPQPAAMTAFQVVPTLEIAGPLAGTGGLLKTGSGVMVLSGVSSLTGPIMVQTGTLAIARSAALGCGSVEIAEGAKLQLDYAGSRRLPALRIAGKDLPAGTYGGKDSIATSKMPAYITGPGMVTIGAARPTTTLTMPPAPLQVSKGIVFTAAATGSFAEMTTFATCEILCTTRKCWKVSSVTYGMLVF